MLDLGLLLAQLVVVLLAARLAGLFVRPLGQPAVGGEMLAGLALGLVAAAGAVLGGALGVGVGLAVDGVRGRGGAGT